MNGDIPVQFLGEGVTVTSPPYPTSMMPFQNKASGLSSVVTDGLGDVEQPN